MPPGPKSGSTTRRVSSSLSKVSTPQTNTPAPPPPPTRAAKSSKPSKIVRIKLPKDQLKVFPHEQRLRKSSHAKASPLSTSKVITSDNSTPSAAVKPEPDSTSTLSGEQDTESLVKDVKSEASTAPKTGVKRDFGALVEGDDNDKAKTNPRKRPRPDPGKPDGRTAAAKAMKGATGTTTAAHKLGPKANQGIINAGLRALDRTARPCRKWVKTEFKVKSFTGRVWEVPSWRTPNSRAFGSESDQGTSNSHSKGNSSSNVGSDKSPAVNPSNQASSPVNGISTPA